MYIYIFMYLYVYVSIYIFSVEISGDLKLRSYHLWVARKEFSSWVFWVKHFLRPSSSGLSMVGHLQLFCFSLLHKTSGSIGVFEGLTGS